MAPNPTQASPRPVRSGYVGRVLAWALLGGVPGVLLVVAAPWLGTLSTRDLVLLTLAVVGWWLGAALALHTRLVRPLQTLANVLSGLREGDYSFQARGAHWHDAMGEVLREVNLLVEIMRQQRLGALEATALLRTVMGEIDVAVFAFDGERRLRLVNRAGERLLAKPAERLLGLKADELGLEGCLDSEAPCCLQMGFPGASGRWGVHRSQFRQGGLPHQLLVLSDLSRELREQEREAWQRIVRVLGHEINNSLAPVKSIAGSLESVLQRDPPPADWRQDMRDGLGVIASRAEALGRFVGAYAQLARLPKPKLQAVDLAPLVERVASLETRLRVQVVPGPDLRLPADPDQLEQLLINLVRNAADALLEGAAQDAGTPRRNGGRAGEGPVQIGWSRSPHHVEVWVQDEGPGVANTANLFVPFFTTKPKGSGIGLVLSRQIAEGHGGSLTLENRADARGCVARLRLPV